MRGCRRKGMVTNLNYHKFTDTVSIHRYWFQWSFSSLVQDKNQTSNQWGESKQASVSFFMVNSISRFCQSHPPPFYLKCLEFITRDEIYFKNERKVVSMNDNFLKVPRSIDALFWRKGVRTVSKCFCYFML